MEHDINLNIHWSAPDEVWDKIGKVYSEMPHWNGNDQKPQWIGENIDLWVSCEPSGLQFAGTMPEDIWITWYALLKEKLTKALGYEIGEPEDGYKFKYFD